LREAQDFTAQHTRNTGLALAIDIGDGNDIHPKNKQEVGRRLALAALHQTYRQNIPYSGPSFRAAKRDGNALRISFHHTEGGLKASGDRLAGFQIAGADHKFVWADAKIEGNEVVVSASGVPEPAYVRYAWDTNPDATLYNGAGLPALPFRSDAPR
jgi:sialate O-acetylesterase